jgi:capsule polysaccharide export protein KpsC/LpsZ
MGEMPKLQEWAKTNPNTLVLAISLDEDYAAFQEATKKFPNMLHYCDLQKWKGTIVSDYFVAATPTFFKLDKERKIVGKYSEFDKLINK